MESAKSKNKQQSPGNVEAAKSKDGSVEASTLIDDLKINTADQR